MKSEGSSWFMIDEEITHNHVPQGSLDRIFPGDKSRNPLITLQNLLSFPVYPQKQQPYGPYGYAAYPGPAAYYGSQYGLPYNQY